MAFSSITFLFAYLPLVLIAYYTIFWPVVRGWHPRFWRHASNLFLLLVSLLFYFWGESWLVWIIVTSTLVDYVCGLIISGGYRPGSIEILQEGGRHTPLQRFGLVFSIVSNLCFLGFFKYFNFGVDTFNALVPEGLRLTGVPRVILPLGISFYTFQSMSYTIDVYRGHVKATRNLLDFAAFVTLFPQLVAGPIVRYADVARQLVERTVSVERIASGIRRFILGLAKKVLIANSLAKASDTIFHLPETQLTASLAWLGAVSFTLQIYYDFSGYSDMAIGLGRMLGFEFLENFNYPYIARSIREFWRRWHISLSTWFRDYVFIPLGGSRCSSARTYFNLWTVFFLCGLWHGATWTFVVWGLYHGGFLVLERIGLEKILARAPVLLRHVYTLLVVLVGLVIFNCDGFAHAGYYLKALVFPAADRCLLHVREYLSADIRLALLAGVIFSAPVAPALARAGRRAAARWRAGWHALEFARLAVLFALLYLSALSLGAGTYNPFIYFRF